MCLPPSYCEPLVYINKFYCDTVDGYGCDLTKMVRVAYITPNICQTTCIHSKSHLICQNLRSLLHRLYGDKLCETAVGRPSSLHMQHNCSRLKLA